MSYSYPSYVSIKKWKMKFFQFESC
uniref:Uncharacterized protein n=1 Tax=Arundo donax TaxID=35708 RepID=A0A0A9A5P9_ARUDO